MAPQNPTSYEVLLELASVQSSPLAKIKCLYAARNAPVASSHMRAYASFGAAQILMNEYCASERALGEAKSLLLSAERDLASCQNSNANSSYLATLSLLGQCHMLLGDDASAASVFQSAARAAASGHSSPPPGRSSAAALARWQAHFLLFLARVEGDPQHGHKKVEEHLKAAEALRIDDPVYRTVLALSQAIGAMQRGDTALADRHLTTTATELGGALRRPTSSLSGATASPPPLTSKHFIESLRAHYYLLYALNAHMGGRTANLSSDESYPAYEEFFKAIERLDNLAEERERDKATTKPGDLECLFLPLDDVDLRTCGEMMYDNVLRLGGCHPNGHPSGSSRENTAGSKAAEATGISGSEALMDPNTNRASGNRGSRNASGMPVTGKCVQFLEYEAMRALTVCDFQLAAKTLLEAVREDSRAAVGGPRSASLPLLLAQYFHSTREYDAALSLLDRLWSPPLSVVDPRAAPRAALVELERNDANAASSRMAAFNDAIDMNALPAQERAVAQMVGGLILLQQDDSTGARLMLTKALKQAHSMVGSGQFVGQILNCLAPVQQGRQDHSGALQMLESSATLLKSAKDLMSLVTTLVAMEKLYLVMKQEEKAASCRQYLEKKNAELTKRLQTVHCSGPHKELLRSASSFVSR